MVDRQIQFETPENVLVTYRSAGLGTRFVAWLMDYMLLTLFLLALGIALLFITAAGLAIVDDLGRAVEKSAPGQIPQLPMYVWGVFTLFFGLGSFVYFGASELFLRGQTLGKRQLAIRVVKMDGFSLSPLSILVRNIFRVIDQVPLLWLVPLLSVKSQRLGDMVGGTIVVEDRPVPVSGLREQLAGRSSADATFRFDATVLQRAGESAVPAAERLLERWEDLSFQQRESFSASLCEALAERLQVPPPDAPDRARFLEDFLAAEYRRQHHRLG